MSGVLQKFRVPGEVLRVGNVKAVITVEDLNPGNNYYGGPRNHRC